jgi:phosphopantothenate-cysteine ligase/phosphopantothenoylcysteine decarboxylase/phosphopantothenate--cysteine ligase
MRILVTAGNTETPVDRVRCITNIFSGSTGTRIALEARRRGHSVCLLTSRPEVVDQLSETGIPTDSNWRATRYRTFDDLHQIMAGEILSDQYDAVIHVAAVSDYQIIGTYGVADGASFDTQSLSWSGHPGVADLVDAKAGKVKSNHDELWLRMKPTPKLVDKIRSPWGFRGVLIKFKLEVDVTEPELMAIAERSRQHSQADLIVANTLQDMHHWAILKDRDNTFTKVSRPNLSEHILRWVETSDPFSSASSSEENKSEVA